jgi:hypothetical protein
MQRRHQIRVFQFRSPVPLRFLKITVQFLELQAKFRRLLHRLRQLLLLLPLQALTEAENALKRKSKGHLSPRQRHQ